MDNYLTVITTVGSIGTVIAIFVAIAVYLSQWWNAQMQIVTSVKAQLSEIREWAGGDGYSRDRAVSGQDDLEWTRPFRIILDIENSAIRDVMVQPGITGFSKQFSEVLAQMNQNIGRIRNAERFREQVASSNIEKSCSLEGEVEKAKKLENPSYGKLIESLGSNYHLKCLADRLHYYSEAIHYDLIGIRENGGLNQNYHELKDVVEMEEQRLNSRMRVVKRIAIILLIIDLIFLNISVVWLLLRR